ncbi:Modification methylase MboII [Bacteroidales bacterium Barb7]|nr:Modification methylase MboII [Bacteroidales bacterium Barb7]
MPRREEQDDRYSNPDNDLRGAWTSSDMTVKTYSADYDYEITTPSGKKIKPTKGRCWFTSKTNFQKLIDDNKVWFGENGANIPRVKKFLAEVQDGIVPISIWLYSEVGHNQEAKQELKEIFSEIRLPFDTPKPTRLIKRIIQLATNKNDIILDRFAGSGTTAHVVLELNKEDGGNRKFILVEMENYANTITAERVRRVINGVPSAKSEALKQGTGGTFSYFELGPTIEMESLLRGNNLPSYTEFARYLFYISTGEEFTESPVNEATGFIGESKNYEVYLIYKPDIEWLKRNALTLQGCQSLPKFKGKQRLVFSPCKYVDDETCRDYRIDFCQLPYEIYRMQK